MVSLLFARTAGIAALCVVASACLGGISMTEPTLIGEGRRVLFIGNSYLYEQDIAGIVQAMADSAGGDQLAVETVAGADMALVDHWNEGTARREIAEGGWEWVVLQQGPSSVEINRDSLRMLTQMFATDIAAVGATPALFSAWPQESRRQDFPRAIESYTLAASDVNGVLLPVAQSWLNAWDANPQLALYSDGLHPSAQGAYLAALVVYARLLGRSTRGIPPTLRLRSGAIVSVAPAVATMLQDAADLAVASMEMREETGERSPGPLQSPLSSRLSEGFSLDRTLRRAYSASMLITAGLTLNNRNRFSTRRSG